VVDCAEEWERMGTLAECFASSPLRASGLEVKRSKDKATPQRWCYHVARLMRRSATFRDSFSSAPPMRLRPNRCSVARSRRPHQVCGQQKMVRRAASRARYDGGFPDRWWQVWWQRWGIKGTRGDRPVSSFSCGEVEG
jgi:hypothetical protein